MIKLLFEKYIEKIARDEVDSYVEGAVKFHVQFGYGVEDEIRQAVRMVAFSVVEDVVRKQGIVDKIALEVVTKINTMQLEKK